MTLLIRNVIQFHKQLGPIVKMSQLWNGTRHNNKIWREYAEFMAYSYVGFLGGTNKGLFNYS